MGLTDAVDVDLASVHGCAVAIGGETTDRGETEGGANVDSGDHQIHCWGQFDGSEPIAYPLEGEAIAVAAGSGHRCGILTHEGDVWCWGSSFYGQLGVPSRL